MSLAAFTLGNVDANGKLETDLDKETAEAIQSLFTSERGSELVKIDNLGDGRPTIDGNLSLLAEDAVRPSNTAVDYFDEKEAIEIDEPLMVQRALQTQTQTAGNEFEEFDAPAPHPTLHVTAPIRTFPAPAPILLPQETVPKGPFLLPEVVHDLFLAPDRLVGGDGLSAEGRLYCSSLFAQGGPIIKFTELFAPQQAKKRRITVTTEPKEIPEAALKAARAPDEQELFQSNDYEAPYHPPPKRRYVILEEHDDDPVGVQPADPIQLPPQHSEEAFDLLRMRAWEEDVIMGDSDTEPAPNDVAPVYSVQWTPENPSLYSDEWTRKIIWDENKMRRIEEEKILLNPNDRNMLFLQENIEPHKPAAHLQRPAAVPAEAKAIKKAPQKRKAEEVVQPEQPQSLDPFNISHDRNYVPTISIQKRGSRANIQHSLPANRLSLVPLSLTLDELRHFHRPRATLTNRHMTIQPLTPHQINKPMNPTHAFERVEDLSGVDNHLILVEYGTEQHPPIIMNVGMGSKVRNYFSQEDEGQLPPQNFEEGETVVLEPNDASPFLGKIPAGQTIQALESTMFRAPIFRHKVPETDFLLIRRINSSRFDLREIPSLFVAGQTIPLMRVHAPSSKAANQFIKQRLQVFIYRLFAAQHHVRLDEVSTMFPDQTEPSIRKRLKDCADFQRGGSETGFWTLKPDFNLPTEEDLRAKVTCEEICLHESMQSGFQRLRDMGIERFNNPYSVNEASETIDEALDPEVRSKLQAVQEELALMPWNQSSMFLTALEGRAKIQLGGAEGGGEQFNFTRVQKNQRDAVPEIEALQDVESADLRKLYLPEAKAILREWGVPESAYTGLDRWKVIDLIRTTAGDMARAGVTDIKVLQFARQQHMTTGQRMTETSQRRQQIFDRMMEQCANPELPNEEEEQEMDALEKELEALLDEEENDDPNRPRSKLPELAAKKKEVTEKEEREALAAIQGRRGLITREDVGKDVGTLRAPAPVVTTGKIVEKISKFIHDGYYIKKTEYIRDPALIEFHLKKKRNLEQSRAASRRDASQYTDRDDVQREIERLQRQISSKISKRAHDNSAAMNSTPKPRAEPSTFLRIHKATVGEGIDRDTLRAKRPNRGSGEVGLNEKFYQIIENLRSTFLVFASPVRDADAPDYHKIVPRPFSLQDMREKAKIGQYQYLSRAEFMADIQLIVDNCIRYNEFRNPHLVTSARMFKAQAQALLKPHMKELEKFEAEIGEVHTRRPPRSIYSNLFSEAVLDLGPHPETSAPVRLRIPTAPAPFHTERMLVTTRHHHPLVWLRVPVAEGSTLGLPQSLDD